MNTTLNRAALAGALLLAAGPLAAQERLLMAWPAGVPGSLSYQFAEDWVAAVEEASGGAVDIDLRGGSAIAGFRDVMEKVESDVVQIGYTLMAQVPGHFALSQVTSLPFLIDAGDEANASAALWRLYETGMLDADYQDVVPLFFGVTAQNHFHFTQAPESMDNLSGLRVRISGQDHTAMAESLGMVPISIPPGDQYVALQRGTIDAALTAWPTFPYASLQEVTDYHVEVPLGGTILFAFMARDRYDALPEAVRAAIDANSNEAVSRAHGAQQEEAAEQGRQLALDNDGEVVQLSSEQLEEWRQTVGAPWTERWLSQTPNGQEVLDSFVALYDAVRAGN